MGRFNAMTSDMRPLFEGIRFVGTAVTVKILASDLAAGSRRSTSVSRGCGGHRLARVGQYRILGREHGDVGLNRGIVAAVIDGACRDVEEIRKIGFPVICKGIVPNVAAIAGYGDVNVPIQCAGVTVSPG
jgi:regulator of RNase E activity RraA